MNLSTSLFLDSINFASQSKRVLPKLQTVLFQIALLFTLGLRSLASEYKQTRNGLDGMEYSTKFSPWLAHGCVSPTIIYAMLNYHRLSAHQQHRE